MPSSIGVGRIYGSVERLASWRDAFLGSSRIGLGAPREPLRSEFPVSTNYIGNSRFGICFRFVKTQCVLT